MERKRGRAVVDHSTSGMASMQSGLLELQVETKSNWNAEVEKVSGTMAISTDKDDARGGSSALPNPDQAWRLRPPRPAAW